MKRFIAITLSLLLALSLAACAGNNNGSVTPTSAPVQEATQAPTQAPADQPADDSTESDADASQVSSEPVRITYASPGDESAKSMQEKDLQAFRDANPDIEVVVDYAFTWPVIESLLALAASGSLPDVYVTNEIPPVVVNQIAADLTPMLAADPDYSEDKVFLNITDKGKINGKQYTMPVAMWAECMMLNKTLLEKENIALPAADWTLDDFLSICEKITQPSKNIYAIEYAQSLGQMFLANATNLTQYGWSYETNKYEFTNPAYAQYWNLAHDIAFNKKYSIDSLDADAANAAFNGQSGYTTGQVAMFAGMIWDIGWFNDNCPDEWIVLPMPKIESQRMKLVSDYVCISPSTKHPEAAYELMKYLTFSKEGYMQALKVRSEEAPPEGKEYPNPYLAFPVVKDQECWNAFMAQPGLPSGIETLIPLVNYAYPDEYRIIAGASEIWMACQDSHVGNFFNGSEKPEDFVNDMQTTAESIYNENFAALEKVTN